MSCITEILKRKGDEPYLIQDGIAIESGGIYKDYEYLVTFTYLGHRCGYVAIPPGHELYNIDSMNGKDIDLDVHGGITHDGKHNIVEKILGYQCDDKWIGFDCGHAGDGADLELVIKVFPYNRRIKEFIKIKEQTRQEFPSLDEFEEIRSNEFVESECKHIIDRLISYT